MARPNRVLHASSAASGRLVGSMVNAGLSRRAAGLDRGRSGRRGNFLEIPAAWMVPPLLTGCIEFDAIAVLIRIFRISLKFAPNPIEAGKPPFEAREV